jgi:hypothetical protein
VDLKKSSNQLSITSDEPVAWNVKKGASIDLPPLNK